MNIDAVTKVLLASPDKVQVSIPVAPLLLMAGPICALPLWGTGRVLAVQVIYIATMAFITLAYWSEVSQQQEQLSDRRAYAEQLLAFLKVVQFG